MYVQALLVLIGLLSAAPAAQAAAAAPGRAAPAGQDPVPDKRPEVEALLGKLKGNVDKGGPADSDALAVMDQILQEFPRSGVKDRASIVAGLSKCFEAKRRANDEGVRDNRIFLSAAVALGQMGADASKALLKWIGHKDHRKDVALQNRLILSLGKTKDKAIVPDLIALLEHKDAPLVGAAAEALSEFTGADLDTRKKGFEGMLKVLMSAQGARDSNLTDTIARERYDTVAAPIITSLGKLAKHDERVPDAWQRWWNKNKTKNWDEEK